MAFRAVLAGCGAMSKGWLKAIAETPALRGPHQHRRPRRSRPRRAERAARRVRPRRRRDRHRSRCGARRHQARPAVRRRHSGGAARRGRDRPRATAATCSPKSRWRHRWTRRASWSRWPRRPGRVHAVVQNRRFIAGRAPHPRGSSRAARSATLTAHPCDFFVGAHFGGFREQMEQRAAARHGDPHARRRALHVGQGRRWRSIASRPIRSGSWYAHGAAANAIFEFSDDVVFTYRGSWCAEGANTSWESAWRIVGTKGTLLWDGDDGFEAQRRRRRRGLLPRRSRRSRCRRPPMPDQTHGHASVIADFLDAIETGARARDGRAATTSRASPWCSPPSKAPGPASASTIAA